MIRAQTVRQRGNASGPPPTTVSGLGTEGRTHDELAGRRTVGRTEVEFTEPNVDH